MALLDNFFLLQNITNLWTEIFCAMFIANISRLFVCWHFALAAGTRHERKVSVHRGTVEQKQRREKRTKNLPLGKKTKKKTKRKRWEDLLFLPITLRSLSFPPAPSPK